MHHLTPGAERELHRWLDEAPYATPVIRHQAALRLLLGRHADPNHLEDVLLRHLEWVIGLLPVLGEVRQRLRDDPELWRHPTPVARYGERFYGADRQAALEALDSLREER